MYVTIASYSLKITCSVAGYVPGSVCFRRLLSIACPFDDDPVDVEAQIIQSFFRRERVIRPCIDLFSYPNDYLKERYRFSKESLIYFTHLLKPHIANVTNRGSPLSTENFLCIALPFFAPGHFLYNVGDAEHVGKATVYRAVRTVCLVFKRFLHAFVQFPGHKALRVIKEEFHRVAASLGDVSRLATSFTDPREVDSYLSLNVSSALSLTAGLLGAFPQRPGLRRCVVNVSSLCALQPFPSWVLYCTGKAARNMMFQVLAKEEPDLRVLSYAPGPLDTEMQVQARSTTRDPALRTTLSALHAEGKLLTCGESAAKLVTLLLEDGYQSGAHIDFYDL